MPRPEALGEEGAPATTAWGQGDGGRGFWGTGSQAARFSSLKGGKWQHGAFAVPACAEGSGGSPLREVISGSLSGCALYFTEGKK